MTVGKLLPACLNDMQQYMNILVLKSNLKYFRIFTKFSFFDASEMLDKQGRCGNALSIQTFHKASLCFSLCHQAATGENANLKRRPMCVRGFPELLKRNVAFRRVRIPFARRDAFARLRLKDVNVDLRHRLSECAERENWLGAMAVLERQMRWCSLSDEDPRQITWLSTQPAKLIEEFRTAPEATSKQMANRNVCDMFRRTRLLVFVWNVVSKSHSVRKSSLERPVLRQAFLKAVGKQSATQSWDWSPATKQRCAISMSLE
ncbi:Hypothetical_protein [Hexamita inflata]|uniref:Hypothetical_protein n=1 Tax=Hexamita inflata TaxID=28002 RepID=A0AA86NUI7_9EUKA|nr:Hypothetical protein HINF_LOCUS12875 [Hexamita inflata]